MAQTGQRAWDLHFAGRGDLETVVSKTTRGFDPDNPGKIIARLHKGDPVVYMATDQYDPNPVVKYNNQMVRIAFNNMVKPSSIETVELHPHKFDIDSKKYSLKRYVDTIRDSIADRDDLAPHLKLYTHELVQNALGHTSKSDVQYIYKHNRQHIPLAPINTQFGEVLGPVHLIANNALRDKGINLAKTARIWFPTDPVYPTIDYEIHDRGRKYAFSAKSGFTTNTVKPSDVLEHINVDPELKRKWQRTEQYKMLQILDEYPSIQGPAVVAATFGHKYPQLSGITMKGATSLSRNGYDKVEFAGYFNKHRNIGDSATPLALAYHIEQTLVRLSRSQISFKEIFIASSENNVIYVRFSIDANGSPRWHVKVADDFKTRRVALRGKNSTTRNSDKLGLQP